MNFAIVLSCSVVMGVTGCTKVGGYENFEGTVLRVGAQSMLVKVSDRNTVAVHTKDPYMPGDKVCVEYVNAWDVPKFWRVAPCKGDKL